MGQAFDKMSNIYLARNILEPHNFIRYRRRRDDLKSQKSFISNLLRYVRRQINKQVECAKIVREARNHFCRQLSRKPFDDLFLEVIFSLFEVVPCGEYSAVCEQLHFFMLQNRIPVSAAAYELFMSGSFHLRDTSNFFINFGYTTGLGLNFEAAQRLIRYGVRLELRSRQMYTILRILNTQVLPLFFGDDDNQLNLEAIRLAYTTKYSKIRLCVVMLVIYVTLLMQKPDHFPACEDSLKSLRLVFRTVRQPFVTVQEVVSFFEISKGVNEKDSRIQEISGNIAKYFPKSTGLLAPRTLKHLSRCEVRKCMGRAHSLPNGVWSLDIPATLQNYLLIQHSEREHFPKYVTDLETTIRSLPQRSCVKRVRV